MAFYDDMAKMAADLLQPDTAGGLGQGMIELRRATVTDPNNPWDSSGHITERLHGAVRGVSQQLVGATVGSEQGGPVILATDRQATCTVPKMGYQAGDQLIVDGQAVTIIRFDRIPAAGTTAAVRFIIR